MQNEIIYIHTLDDLETHANIKKNFMRRILGKMPELADEPYGKKIPPENKLYFSNNGLQLFKQAGILKNNHAGLPAIVEELRKGLPNAPEKPIKRPTNQQSNDGETAHQSPLADILKSSQEEAKQAFNMLLAEKDKRLSEKEELLEERKQSIRSLQQQVLLLTDGRDPKEIKREQEQQAAALAAAEAEARRVADALVQERQAKETAERERQEAQNALELERKKSEAATRRAQIHQELATLGFFAGTRKKELRKELASLDASTGIPTEAGK